MSEAEEIKPHVFTDEEGRFMWNILDNINALMWDSFMVKNGPAIPGHEIIKELEGWAGKL